jgi:hypothetical protein
MSAIVVIVTTTEGPLRRGLLCTAAVAATLFAGTAIPGPVATADSPMCTQVGTFCGFYSPSHRIDCEIDTGDPARVDSVYCKTIEPARSVTLDDSGSVRTCAGETCLGDAAENTPTLEYGQTVTLGPFRCLSEKTGMTCTTAAGRGFLVSTAGITTVG